MTKPRTRIADKKPPEPVEWTRSETLALAQQSCTFCFGLGMRPGRAGASTPCNCVFRTIFRVCYDRWRTLVASGGYATTTSWDGHEAAARPQTYGFKFQEYCADFYLVSQRTLTAEQHRLFRFHYMLGADWKLCCRKLGMERGEFFHEIYRIEQKLGRTFRELQPHSLFPLDEYFTTGRGKTKYECPDPFSAFGAFGEDEEEDTEEPSKKVLRFPVRGRPRSVTVIAQATSGD